MIEILKFWATWICTIFILGFSVPACSKSSDLQLELTIAPADSESRWRIHYSFSQKVDEVDFENIPYAFLASSWEFSGELSLDFDTLRLKNDDSFSEIDIELTQLYDQFIPRWYTPFLNFSDSSHAFYLQYFIPQRARIGNEWHTIKKERIDLKLTVSEYPVLVIDGKLIDTTSEVSIKLTHTPLTQYVYLGHQQPKVSDRFLLLFDPELPTIFATEMERTIPLVMEYMSKKLRANLPFKPLILVNLNPGDNYPRSDGGATQGQVALNFVGNGWVQQPENNIENALLLLTHEIAHLWNAQFWQQSAATPLWMNEGSAEFIAANSLYSLGILSQEGFQRQISRQIRRCKNELIEHSINSMARAPQLKAAYACGALILEVSARALRFDQRLELWRRIMAVHSNPEYSEEDFFKLLDKRYMDQEDKASIDRMLNGNEGSYDIDLVRMVKKYQLDQIK